MPRGDKKAYETLTARMPQALVDQARRYAAAHHTTVADLLREGLALRLEAVTGPTGTPRPWRWTRRCWTWWRRPWGPAS